MLIAAVLRRLLARPQRVNAPADRTSLSRDYTVFAAQADANL